MLPCHFHPARTKQESTIYEPGGGLHQTICQTPWSQTPQPPEPLEIHFYCVLAYFTVGLYGIPTLWSFVIIAQTKTALKYKLLLLLWTLFFIIKTFFGSCSNVFKKLLKSWSLLIKHRQCRHKTILTQQTEKMFQSVTFQYTSLQTGRNHSKLFFFLWKVIWSMCF